MKNWRFALALALLKDWRFLLGLIASLLVCYLCFAYPDKVVRVVCVLLAVFLAFVSFMFFERLFVRIKHKEFFETTTSGKARFPGSNKACVGLGTVALVGGAVFIYLGCHRSYRDADLIGSWRLRTGRVTQTYTFSPEHSFTIVTASSKDLRYFGDWAIEHGQLLMTIRSNSFAPPVTNRETARIGKLTRSVLVLIDRDMNDESLERERRFQKLR